MWVNIKSAYDEGILTHQAVDGLPTKNSEDNGNFKLPPAGDVFVRKITCPKCQRQRITLFFAAIAEANIHGLPSLVVDCTSKVEIADGHYTTTWGGKTRIAFGVGTLIKGSMPCLHEDKLTYPPNMLVLRECQDWGININWEGVVLDDEQLPVLEDEKECPFCRENSVDESGENEE